MDDKEDVYRLVRENNRMLHAMRRNAFVGGIIKLLLYVGLFVALPLWLYATYLAPITEQALGALGQIQGTGVQAKNQISELQNLLKQLQGGFWSQ